MDSLYQKSLQIIIENQSTEGAYIACPTFRTYQYAWFRDGSFCAYAVSQAGYPESAYRFHQWASQIVLRYRQKILSCIEDTRLDNPLVPSRCFHSRFTLPGYEVPGNWGNHQLDGLGTWLWSLNEFHRAHPEIEIPEQWQHAATLVKDYLSALWPFPCSDCWEENENSLHTYTLSSVYAGLVSYAALFSDDKTGSISDSVRTLIISSCVRNGSFIKSVGRMDVDANLLGLFFPYHLVEWHDPVFQATLAHIKLELATPLGLHRYRKDTYYGSGEWILLTEWLGCVYAEAGDIPAARSILAWAEDQASPQGYLAEQVPHGLYDKNAYARWVMKWGEIASPLLWSHANYVILRNMIPENPETE
jgi:GH15 family glucan-1,4-alpha-glucosidase